jgi:hypothetical protein
VTRVVSPAIARAGNAELVITGEIGAVAVSAAFELILIDN